MLSRRVCHGFQRPRSRLGRGGDGCNRHDRRGVRPCDLWQHPPDHAQGCRAGAQRGGGRCGRFSRIRRHVAGRPQRGPSGATSRGQKHAHARDRVLLVGHGRSRTGPSALGTWLPAPPGGLGTGCRHARLHGHDAAECHFAVGPVCHFGRDGRYPLGRDRGQLVHLSRGRDVGVAWPVRCGGVAWCAPAPLRLNVR